jgi:hypothetical protein
VDHFRLPGLSPVVYRKKISEGIVRLLYSYCTSVTTQLLNYLTTRLIGGTIDLLDIRTTFKVQEYGMGFDSEQKHWNWLYGRLIGFDNVATHHVREN